MKQLLQDLTKDVPDVVEAPAPQVKPGTLLVDAKQSLISAGTERMLVDFGRANLLQKARQQPDKVKQVLQKARTDGVATTVDAVRSKLAQPIPLGYCSVGVVRAVGAGIEGFQPGDRVTTAAPHADVVRVPKHLAAKVPDTVPDDQAAFTVLASIGLQGVRLAKPELGEAFVVTGAGLIGLMCVQLLRAQGCRVLAIDFDADKLALAQTFGAEICNPGQGGDPLAAAQAFSRGAGVDGVLVTASTKSSDPINQAASMCRKRGRVIQVGLTGLDLLRAEFYDKEISLQVSCSYGPGRYDPAYEEGGQDYPIGFVRWTEQRNFEAILDMMAEGRIDTAPLISHRFRLEDAPQAYELLTQDKTALGILLTYDSPPDSRHQSTVALAPSAKAQVPGPDAPALGVIGAGNYATRMLIPAFQGAGAKLHTIASSGGVNGVVHGTKSGFAHATSDSDALLADPDIDAAVIVTRHDSHAEMTLAALEAGKHVFVEKPLALTHNDLDRVEAAAKAHPDKMLMVGFNRRFAPQVQTMKQLLDPVTDPKSFVMVMNAGAIPADHWIQDPAVGGGRILGEACHYIDLMRYLAGAPIVSVQTRRMGDAPGVAIPGDKAAIMLGFADGSFGTIHYLANGGASFPKERIEVFAAGATLQLDNFLKLRGFGWPGFRKQGLWRQDKGQAACAAAFLQAIRDGGPSPIPLDELIEGARITIEAADLIDAQP